MYARVVRSYDQYCGVAKALDVVGDRWTLLIVRELLIRGRSRYTDLQQGLPGVATNLLADRLRRLEEAGVIASEAAPPPIATTLFSLTPRGRELEPVLRALGHWVGPQLELRPEDEFRTHWLAFPLGEYLQDNAPQQAPIVIEVRTGDEPLLIEANAGAVTTRLGSTENPDAVLEGSPDVVFAALTGRLGLQAAKARGLRYRGKPATLRRIQPTRER